MNQTLAQHQMGPRTAPFAPGVHHLPSSTLLVQEFNAGPVLKMGPDVRLRPSTVWCQESHSVPAKYVSKSPPHPSIIILVQESNSTPAYYGARSPTLALHSMNPGVQVPAQYGSRSPTPSLNYGSNQVSNNAAPRTQLRVQEPHSPYELLWIHESYTTTRSPPSQHNMGPGGPRCP